MTHLENQLRKALQRPEPPTGFAERVLARAQQRSLRRRPKVLLVAATLLALLLPMGWIQYQRIARQRQLEGEQARAQLMLALAISSEKLNHAFKKLQQDTREVRP